MDANRALNRRRLLLAGAVITGASLFERYVLGTEIRRNSNRGTLLDTLGFQGETDALMGVPIASELDERLYTDLSRLSDHRTVTPVSDFFIRTGVSKLVPPIRHWIMTLDGLVEHEVTLDIQRLRTAAKPMGLHFMECAGNNKLTHFGLIGVANWTGVPLLKILTAAKVLDAATRVLVSGFDEYGSHSSTSRPGASWIFSLEELQALNAFLATGMNGQPLTANHGAPVRLVVPGWYGCSCIKWVNRITLVDDTAEPTSQMQEYAARTLQNGLPLLAKDYQPPRIDHAAMPVRVEKWRVDGKLEYRVIGILWGGSEPVKTLKIRFNPQEDFVAVQRMQQVDIRTWTRWEHRWLPAGPGLYSIRLAVTDPVVQARKMDAGLYDRAVEINEI